MWNEFVFLAKSFAQTFIPSVCLIIKFILKKIKFRIIQVCSLKVIDWKASEVRVNLEREEERHFEKALPTPVVWSVSFQTWKTTLLTFLIV